MRSGVIEEANGGKANGGTAMKTRWALLCVAVFMFQPAAPAADGGQPARFDNHKLVQVRLATPADVETMLAISKDHWSDGVGVGSLLFRVPPDRMDDLRDSGLSFAVRHENIQELIDRQRLPAGPEGGWFEEYHTNAEIIQRLNELVALEPDLVSMEEIGASIEGRPIYALTVANDVGGPDKPAVFFNGCQHAREWITPAVVMYVVDKVVTEYDTNPEIQELVNDVTLYFVPMVNPDGYVYTWDVNRQWRKNRRNNGGGIYGVDLNRNWAYEWGGEGSSPNPSSWNYHGTEPFSEPETQAVRDFVFAHPDIVFHIDYHSYGQLVLWPFGYADGADPPEPDRTIFENLGHDMADAIYGVHSMNYRPMPIYDLYPAAGNCPDWMYGDQGIWSYCFELRDTGEFAFLLPPEQIIPNGEEIFEATVVMVDFAATPLQFEFPAGLPPCVQPNTATPVPVSIFEIGGTLAPDTAKLYYRFGGGAFVETDLTPLGGFSFEATLPAMACGAPLEYYFAAQSTTGVTITSPEDAPESLYETLIQPSEIVFEDDMEQNLGWVGGIPGDTATTGIWNRMDPEGTAAQPEDDHTPPPGTICWVTDGNAGSNIGEFDVDGGHTTLLSPIFDASQGDTVVSYWRWYSNDEGASPHTDVFTIDISNDAGQSWENAEIVGPAGPQASGGWFYYEFLVADILVPSDNMQMRFIAADEEPGSIVEAAVDDFMVVARYPCPVVPGDLNCDGEVNAFDIDPFVLALTDRTSYGTTHANCNLENADCNGDGEINAFDIDPFVELLTGP